MRRVITGNDESGRSMVITDDEVADHGMATLWRTTDADVNPAAADAGRLGFEPERGSAAWMCVDISPDAQMRELLAAGAAGIDPDGWHTTATVDYVYVVSGPVVLLLDKGEVELQAGDCLVQRATRHAWRNRTEQPARLSCVMVGMG